MSSVTLHNWNYDATGLLSQVERIVNRDRTLFGSVVQRSVTQKNATGVSEHVITVIEVLPPEIHQAAEDLDYGTVRFVQEVYSLSELITRLQGLNQLRIAVGRDAFQFEAKFGFSDQYEPSDNCYGKWPGTVFHVAAIYSILPTGPLWHPHLPSHGSVFAAMREFLKLRQFNDHSDSRLGHVVIYFPNFNARLERLTLNGLDLTISIAGAMSSEHLIVEVLYSHEEHKQRSKKPFSSTTERVTLDFRPSELNVLIFSSAGDLLDFHDETPMFSRGCNRVLPKAKAMPASFIYGEDGIPETIGVSSNSRPTVESDVSSLSLKLLPNKEQLLSDVHALLEQACELAILVIDLDNFKRVNDTNGHPAGDACLEAVVSIIGAIVSGKGKFYRWGGDEFAVVLCNFDVTEAQATAERIRVSIERSGVGGDVLVTTSIGVVAADKARAASPEELLGAADKAMYASKNGGKNRVTALTGRTVEEAAGTAKPATFLKVKWPT
jgi:diguanylate cyclase (GGDEF)-like protein